MLYVLGLIALLIVAIALYARKIRFGLLRQVKAVEARLLPVREALKRGENPDPLLLQTLAEDPETRNPTLLALEEAGKTALFPAAYRTREQFAASDLALWLGHPNELGTTPPHLELTGSTAIPHEIYGPLDYFLFRFRTDPPHPKASRGWMVGVSGPYSRDPHWPLFSPPGTYSPLKGEGRAEGHALAQKVHQRCLRDGRLDLWIQEALRRL